MQEKKKKKLFPLHSGCVLSLWDKALFNTFSNVCIWAFVVELLHKQLWVNAQQHLHFFYLLYWKKVLLDVFKLHYRYLDLSILA